MATVTVFASPASWIESDAVAQCHQVAALDGMRHVAAMPDLHPGKGAPIGAAMASTVLYPFLVGSDIGCGIAVFPIKLKRAVPERLAARFPDLDRALDPDAGRRRPGLGRRWTAISPPVTSRASARSAGATTSSSWPGSRPSSTPDHASRLGLAAGDLVLIVHSGSRGLGERILRAHTEVHGAGPAPDPGRLPGAARRRRTLGFAQPAAAGRPGRPCPGGRAHRADRRPVPQPGRGPRRGLPAPQGRGAG